MGQRGPKPGIRIGGRQKGAKNKATIAKERLHNERVEAAANEGISPLEVMLENMRFAHSQAAETLAKMVGLESVEPQDLKELLTLRGIAQECAKEAAPYLHPRLSAIEANVTGSVKHDVDDYTTQELIAIARRGGGMGSSAPKGKAEPH